MSTYVSTYGQDRHANATFAYRFKIYKTKS